MQSVGGNTDLLIRLAPHGEHAPGTGDAAAEDKATAAAVVKALSTADNQATVLRNEFVGPQIGKDLAMNGLYATIFMLAGFLIYIAVRFEWKFAVTASIVAMFDLIVTVAYVSLLGREFDLTVLAGLLSVMGFAINDIIVVFDRVRENFRSLRVDSMEVLNRSINQTLSRTVITAVMFFPVRAGLYLYGGSSMEGLAETHMIGAVIVVLSSILVAVPMLTIGFLRVSKQDLLPKAKDVEAWPVARKRLLHAHREPRASGFLCRACSPAPAVVPAAGLQQQQRAFRGVAGPCGLAGHAVNPSLGSMAPSMAPTVLNPHGPTSDRSPRLWVGVDLGRHICQISKQFWGQIRFPSKTDLSCSDRSRKTVKGGVGPVAGVSAAWMPRPSHGRLTASPQPDPPRHPSVARLLTLLLRLPASGRHYRR